MTRSESYSCTITRNDEGQITALAVDASDVTGTARSVQVNGYRATQVIGPVQEVLRGGKVTGRQWTQPGALELAAGVGVHVELLLRAVKPLKRIDRIAGVAAGIAAMSREEAAYWHAQASRRRGLRALRVLLEEAR